LLFGGDGADLLIGGAGADTLDGGAGADIVVVDDPGDVVVERPGEGIDTMRVETTQAVTLAPHVEILRIATAGGSGNGAAGGNGIGSPGADLLIGGAAGDRLDGRGGADVIEGRGGNDTLTGGLGADSFILRRGDGFDRIEDFAPGLDDLVLTGFGLTATAALALARETAGGVSLDLGGGDGVLLAGLRLASLTAADLVL
jgi:Ca2+-binding RTX toxin-like protein